MKPKRLDKRLNLNKETIIHLEPKELGKAWGGGTGWYDDSCYLFSCERTFCDNCTQGENCYYP